MLHATLFKGDGYGISQTSRDKSCLHESKLTTTMVYTSGVQEIMDVAIYSQSLLLLEKSLLLGRLFWLRYPEKDCFLK